MNHKVSVSTAQYNMRPISSWSEIEDQISSFAYFAKEHQSHILLLPEYFCIHYMNCLPSDWPDIKRFNAVVEKYDQYVTLLKSLAIKHQLFIVGGSHPVRKDGLIYNVAHLISPAGNNYAQEKLHITPLELETWDYFPGSGLKLFDTPFGRIGIQVCYDIEFPEIARLMALNGAEIIFVPFFTSDQYGYQRVRYTAQARAVENYLFTIISGSFGKISGFPSVNCYSQSAIFTPSDIGFPPKAIAAEADPYKEMVVFADLDLAYLRKIRINGTVKPLLDRREDIYTLQIKNEIEIIEVN